jgi:hypothetical protein
VFGDALLEFSEDIADFDVIADGEVDGLVEGGGSRGDGLGGVES